MSSLRLNVTLAETDEAKLMLPAKYHEVEIEAPGLDDSNLCGSLIDGLASFGSTARRAAAEKTGRAEDLFFPVAIAVIGAVNRNYSVEGVYPGDGGLWGDTVSAVNSSEAEFQASWIMYDNVVGGMETLVALENSYEGYIGRIARGLGMQRIESVEPAAPGRHEILQALEEMHADARSAGMEWASLDKAKALIDAEQAALEQADDIDYLVSTSAPAP